MDSCFSESLIASSQFFLILEFEGISFCSIRYKFCFQPIVSQANSTHFAPSQYSCPTQNVTRTLDGAFNRVPIQFFVSLPTGDDDDDDHGSRERRAGRGEGQEKANEEEQEDAREGDNLRQA